MGNTILGGFGMAINSEEFNKELELTKDGYNFLNNDGKKKIIKRYLSKISKEKNISYIYKELFNKLIPVVNFDELVNEYNDEEEQIEFLQYLQYLISRKIVNENLATPIIRETNENLKADIEIVNRGYRILNEDGKRKLVEWCIKTLEESYKIILTDDQFVDIFVETVDFEALANIYFKEEEKQMDFLQNIASIMQELISLNLVDENYGKKQYDENKKRR